MGGTEVRLGHGLGAEGVLGRMEFSWVVAPPYCVLHERGSFNWGWTLLFKGHGHYNVDTSDPGVVVNVGVRWNIGHVLALALANGVGFDSGRVDYGFFGGHP